MKKNIVYTISLVISIIVIVICIWFNIKLKNDIGASQTQLKQTEHLMRQLNEDQITIVDNSDTCMSKFLHLSTVKGEPVRIDSLIGNKRYLALFISSDDCGACVDFSLNQIRKIASQLKEKKILIFASKYQLRDLFILAKSINIDAQILSIDKTGLPIEKENIPFIFLIDKELKPTHLFIPRKEIPDQTDLYFKKIRMILD